MLKKNVVNVCISPAMYEQYKTENDIVVVIDVFRATSAMCAGLGNGISAFRPFDSVEATLKMRAKGYIVAGERNGEKVEGFDLGNSPIEFLQNDLVGKKVAITTTNGTQAVNIAGSSEGLVLGSFLNFNALLEYLKNQGKNVLLLCSGWKMKVNYEDSLFAGAMAQSLIESGNFISADNDAQTLAINLYRMANGDLKSFMMKNSPRISRRYAELEEDFDYCLQWNKWDVVPKLANGEFVVD